MKITELAFLDYGNTKVWLMYYERHNPINGHYPNIVINDFQAKSLLEDNPHEVSYSSLTLVKYMFINQTN